MKECYYCGEKVYHLECCPTKNHLIGTWNEGYLYGCRGDYCLKNCHPTWKLGYNRGIKLTKEEVEKLS